MSLQNFKKPFVDYISANRKKKHSEEYLVIVSIPIKIKIFWSVDFTTILTHDKIVLDQSHRTAAEIPLGPTRVLNLFITKNTINLTLLDQ